jgi:hypothetical protein
MLRFHITQEIFKLLMIHSFDLMKLMCFETIVTTFIFGHFVHRVFLVLSGTDILLNCNSLCF